MTKPSELDHIREDVAKAAKAVKGVKPSSAPLRGVWRAKRDAAMVRAEGYSFDFVTRAKPVGGAIADLCNIVNGAREAFVEEHWDDHKAIQRYREGAVRRWAEEKGTLRAREIARMLHVEVPDPYEAHRKQLGGRYLVHRRPPRVLEVLSPTRAIVSTPSTYVSREGESDVERVQGVGLSAPEPSVGLDDFSGDDIAADAHPTGHGAMWWEEKGE